MHEIGSGSPYKLYFAAKAKSGASFGAMQGDLAAGQKVATDTFKDVLTAAGADGAKIHGLLQRLSVHLISNPLSPQDTQFINNALAANSALVDAMDQDILQDVYSSLDLCIKAAGKSSRTMSDKALLYAALWINMSGRPTRLLDWLNGKDPHLARPVAPAARVVDALQMRAYLMATDYYVNNPKNAGHLDDSVRAGAQLLP
jgi:hypothetical protein